MFTILTCLKIDLEKGVVTHNEFSTLIKGEFFYAFVHSIFFLLFFFFGQLMHSFLCCYQVDSSSSYLLTGFFLFFVPALSISSLPRSFHFVLGHPLHFLSDDAILIAVLRTCAPLVLGRSFIAWLAGISCLAFPDATLFKFLVPYVTIALSKLK